MLVPPNAAHCGSAGDGSLPRVRDIADESRFLARAKRQTRKSDSLPEHCAVQGPFRSSSPNRSWQAARRGRQHFSSARIFAADPAHSHFPMLRVVPPCLGEEKWWHAVDEPADANFKAMLSTDNINADRLAASQVEAARILGIHRRILREFGATRCTQRGATALRHA